MFESNGFEVSWQLLSKIHLNNKITGRRSGINKAEPY